MFEWNSRKCTFDVYEHKKWIWKMNMKIWVEIGNLYHISWEHEAILHFEILSNGIK